MTDTGQVPGEGLPESAGMAEHPGAPAAHGAYGYLSETTAEDEDLLMPGSHGAWGNEVAPPAPEPVVEAVHQPGAHEISGRDSGSVDLSDVRLSTPTAPSAPIPPITPRRPLHLGPLIPDASASPVRSLADRGAVAGPARQPGLAPAGPEYLDATVPQPATAWPAPAPSGVQAQVPAPVPVGAEAAAAETVVPTEQPVGAAQAVVARVATEAGAVTGAAQEAAAVDAGQEAVAAHPSGAGVPGADEDAGVVSAPAVEQVEQVHQVAQVAFVGEAPEGGQGVEDGPVLVGAEAADAVVGEVAQIAEVPVAAVGQVPDGSGPGDAPVSEVPLVAEAGQVVGMPAAEAGQVVGMPAPEAGQVVEMPVAEVGQAAEGAVPGTGHGAAPESEPLPEALAPQAVSVPDAPAPDAPAPEAVQLPDALAPEPVHVLGDAVPEAPAQLSEPLAPEAVQAPEAAQVLPDAAQAIPEAAPLPPAPDAAQAPQPVDADPVVPAPQPTDAGPAPVDDAPVVVAPEPVPHPADADQAAQQQSAPLAPAELPAQAPEALMDPNLAQQPTQDGADAEAHAVPVSAPAVEVGAPVADPAPVAEPDAGQIPDAPRAPDVAAESAVAPQPLPAAAPQPAAVETPEPFVAEPAGPQLRSAQVVEVQAAPSVPLAEYGEGEATDVLTTGMAQEPAPEQPLGQFVAVEGSVPTTPHLAPTPPQPIVLPMEQGPGPVPMVPAPREGDPELVQHADDLDTRAADQEDQAEESTAVVEEARQSTGPAAPAYDDAEREAVLKVMRERRDIRNGFRSDPIPHEVLLRVLEAAHTAPSVGHSQPWDFVVIRSSDTRRTMHELAMRQREAYAKSLPKGRAKQFKELKIEAILDTPVNIVVTADPTRGGRHTLGRHTQPQMAPYSAALAVENLWLAARAEGLGVGWVSFFDEREMVRALGLPEHLEVIAYLCVGYVDEFPDEPELMQAGWSKRRPLSWVVHEETYGRRALPGEEPHDLLGETVAQIRPLDAKALGEAWERQKRMTKPPGSLGMLEIISAQLSGLSRQCPPPIPEPAAVAIFAGDHGVHAQGVTPWPQEVTAQMVANFLGGGAVCNAFAGQVGAEVCVVDVGVAADLPATPGLLPRKVRAGTSDMTTGPAMTREEAKQAIEVGIETARDLVAAGNKALLTGEMGIANTTASAALISVFTGAEPAEVTGRGTGINDETLARKTEVVRRALEHHQPDPADPIGVLAAIGGFEHAAIVGLLLGGASLRTPVILDGVSAGAAALVARAIAPEVLAACIAGHRSAEPGHVAALNKLGLRPLVDLDLRLGEGTGALLALPLVQSTARAMHEVATFDSAGVTEK
ncbi:nicotinate-nucleotide--dimethylbenzimidazole phosphoribosyltransferase [Streptomyces sp. NPDC056479]|uniref:nicotinate-nucleotide--dimethylbenzimidazole phosphoribosyltransferase n=1 Tax=Streptomyces sp. NPDC056479 TaxID=3345832 RepID=UPI0036D01D56